MNYLLDSDFLFGLVVKNDPHHTTCKKSYASLGKDVKLVALNLVIQETATVISRKRNQRESILFLQVFRELPVKIIPLDLEIENLAWSIFESKTKKGISFIDCANLAVLEKYKLDGILSFDEFYPQSVKPF